MTRPQRTKLVAIGLIAAFVIAGITTLVGSIFSIRITSTFEPMMTEQGDCRIAEWLRSSMSDDEIAQLIRDNPSVSHCYSMIVPGTPLLWPMVMNRPAVVRALVMSGADLNATVRSRPFDEVFAKLGAEPVPNRPLTCFDIAVIDCMPEFINTVVLSSAEAGVTISPAAIKDARKLAVKRKCEACAAALDSATASPQPSPKPEGT